MWDIKYNNLHVIEIPEEKEKEKGTKIFEEIIAKNFQNFMKTFCLHIKKFSIL